MSIEGERPARRPAARRPAGRRPTRCPSDGRRHRQPQHGARALYVAVRGSQADGHRLRSRCAGAGRGGHRGGVAAGRRGAAGRGARRSARGAACWRGPGMATRPRPCTLIGVTGTNGKTTTTGAGPASLQRSGHRGQHRHARCLRRAGRPPCRSTAGSLTTPGPVDLQATLAALRDRGCTHVAMETSSHSLDQGRLDGLAFAAGIFTNLTRDHLDYHGTMEAYLAAKLRLSALLGLAGFEVVNLDDPAWAPSRRGRGASPSAIARRRRARGGRRARCRRQPLPPDGTVRPRRCASPCWGRSTCPTRWRRPRPRWRWASARRGCGAARGTAGAGADGADRRWPCGAPRLRPHARCAEPRARDAPTADAGPADRGIRLRRRPRPAEAPGNGPDRRRGGGSRGAVRRRGLRTAAGRGDGLRDAGISQRHRGPARGRRRCRRLLLRGRRAGVERDARNAERENRESRAMGRAAARRRSARLRVSRGPPMPTAARRSTGKSPSEANW